MAGLQIKNIKKLLKRKKMDIRDYSKYFDITSNDLHIDELKHLQMYFSLLKLVEKPIASLVIPVYRAKETLLAHVISLSNLKTIIPYEVLFIDNNADEITLNILDQLGATVIKEQKQGITYARQKGLECAKGEIICTMDPDTIYDPYYIDKMVLPFFKDKDLVLCCSVSKSYENNFQLSTKMQLRNWIKEKYFKRKLSQSFMNRIKHVRAVAMAMRKNTLIPLGYPIDLKAVAGCDDGMIAIQLNLIGKCKYVSANIFTALPPPRDPGKPFPFCNERFIKF
jgi:glycosyltransferase involved in cell wall biosynthesis